MIDPQWYKEIWTLEARDMSWTEQTIQQVDFVVEILQLQGQERVLDLACGWGRHALELARRGCSVVGVDITTAYVDAARRQAAEEGLDTEFICADLRDVSFNEEFDVVLNLADGAIGYLETDAENLKIFDLVAAALKPGGKHLMDICSGAHAAKHFPRRNWEAGSQALSLADFDWDSSNSRMLYGGYTLKYGERLAKPECSYTSTRLYALKELREILGARGMTIKQACGGYDRDIPVSDDRLALVVYSEKHELAVCE